MLIKTRVSKPQKSACVVCKDKTCVDNQHGNVCRSILLPKYSGRITRSMSKIHKIMNEFVVCEVYRCMPLLGDEKNNAPDWDVHIVHYAVTLGESNKKPYVSSIS